MKLKPDFRICFQMGINILYTYILGRDGGAETSLRERTMEKRASWLKAAVDFYLLSTTDVMVSPVWSSFGDGAARRAFPFTPVVVGLCTS